MLFQDMFLQLLLHGTVIGYPAARRRQASHYERLIVFGDSFSDDGNGSWLASNMTWPADPAYAGHHFSNGPVWSQDLAIQIGVALLDYATGGATADNNIVQGYTGYNSTIPVPSMIDQITEFLSNDTVLPGDILTLYIGANDILFNTSVTGQQIARIIEGQVHRLYNLGARTVLLADYPNLNFLPADSTLDPSDQASVTQFGVELKDNLELIVDGWLPYVEIAVAPIGDLFQMIENNPEAYGINASYVHPPTACLVGAYVGEGPRILCSDPSRHLFFDTYHPVYEVHQLMANVFSETLKTL